MRRQGFVWTALWRAAKAFHVLMESLDLQAFPHSRRGREAGTPPTDVIIGPDPGSIPDRQCSARISDDGCGFDGQGWIL
ncbi:hypothetical protein ATN84_02620 [Paramesorhizobium deserti]|uniref:Uncharacterized protein n=1 Tax=Paramesorhizobium deserti TaxID=1494590 RepID=A0A135HZR0_9HYPH|nr:hypothetical protein ATN84_02620 [Paramesorhizobium deserti]